MKNTIIAILQTVYFPLFWPKMEVARISMFKLLVAVADTDDLGINLND